MPHPLWQFWFHETPRERWFRKDPAFDETLRERFGDLPDRALAGEFAADLDDPHRGLAVVLMLDQLPRNLFRGDARSFHYDPAARLTATLLLDRGADAALSVDERAFLYLPFEHSERLADQDRSIALYEALDNPLYLDFARRHRDIIVRFGRFPHRNAVLGRPNTPEEAQFLEQPGSGF